MQQTRTSISLVLFHFNNILDSTQGPDRIRMRAPRLLVWCVTTVVAARPLPVVNRALIAAGGTNGTPDVASSAVIHKAWACRLSPPMVGIDAGPAPPPPPPPPYSRRPPPLHYGAPCRATQACRLPCTKVSSKLQHSKWSHAQSGASQL